LRGRFLARGSAIRLYFKRLHPDASSDPSLLRAITAAVSLGPTRHRFVVDAIITAG